MIGHTIRNAIHLGQRAKKSHGDFTVIGELPALLLTAIAA